MCLNPRIINNPARYISMRGGQPLRFPVQCGECAECKKAKRLEWHFRTYHHVMNCIKNGGYVLYDTLTYRPADVPRVSRHVDLLKYVPDLKRRNIKKYDFMCFDANDWRKFLKNLRRQLNYYYPGASFTYFLTSEYGTDEKYTHRPHYHVMFFVNSANYIDPLEFSTLVAKCWKYGRTDGLPYQPKSYVLAKRVFDNSTPNDTCLKACAYVAKYITKDSTFQTHIENRLSFLQLHLDKEEYTKVKREVSQFHRQSQGFGISFLSTLSDFDLKSINDSGCCHLMDKDKITLTIPLPLYYKRKLFYKQLKNEDNTYRWIPTPQGVDFLYHNFIRSFENNYCRYYTIYVNSTSLQKEVVRTSLGERTLSDFVSYITFYRGRCRSLNHFDFNLFSPNLRLHDDEYNLHDWFTRCASSSSALPDEPDTLCHYKTKVSKRDLIDIPCVESNIFKDFTPTKTIDYDIFIRSFQFSENSLPDFVGFDRLEKYFSFITKKDNLQAQKTFDYIEDLSNKFKILFNDENQIKTY